MSCTITSTSNYLVLLSKVAKMAEGGNMLTLPAGHPVAQQVEVMATLGEQREGTLTLLVPVASNIRVGKVPKTDLPVINLITIYTKTKQ